jgi:hypothetical protein
MVVQYSFLVMMSIRGGILIMTGSWWRKNVITHIFFISFRTDNHYFLNGCVLDR